MHPQIAYCIPGLAICNPGEAASSSNLKRSNRHSKTGLSCSKHIELTDREPVTCHSPKENAPTIPTTPWTKPVLAIGMQMASNWRSAASRCPGSKLIYWPT